MRAVLVANIELVRFILRQDKVQVTHKDVDGRTARDCALSLACQDEIKNEIISLLDVNINSKK